MFDRSQPWQCCVSDRVRLHGLSAAPCAAGVCQLWVASRAFWSNSFAQTSHNLPLRTLRLPDDAIRPHAAAWALEDGSDKPIILEAVSGGGAWIQSGASGLWFGVPANGALSSLLSLLTEADRQQILRLRNLRDQWSVAAARAVVRILLGQCLDCPAQDVALIRDERGKPMLDPRRHGTIARQLHFSISHGRELIAVAIAHSRIGIDVEAVCELPELMQIASMQFAPESLDDLKVVETDAERTALFYRFWTLGEAFVKATGEGIAQGLKSIAFSAYGDPVLTRVDGPLGPHSHWRFGTLACGRSAVSCRDHSPVRSSRAHG
jgi:4'-phosphopantetheinyl transferase